MQNNEELLDEKKRRHRNAKVENAKANFRSVRRLVIIVLLIAGFIIYKEIRKLPSIDKIENASVGDKFSFGTYTWAHIIGRKTTPLEWIVIDKDDEKAVLLCEYGLNPNVNYEEMLTYLATTFYEKNLEEDSRIVPNSSGEFVSIMSVDEAKKYMETVDEVSTCKPYVYANKHHSSIFYKAPYSAQWLRAPENIAKYREKEMAPYISADGKINEEGIYYDGIIDVRPLIWISLK